ncbi:hypothetical protein [Congregibacter litoralis]|uniref:Uncharacterized protein n=1 Tax=Congregibacter litoralis KT71 TaxID=314285 RepID=A4AD24_9GAMM|nr:hypothetical protein [Congregibacter litoralis]EAQ96077.1 hypothetical protein KT71_08475 [Congregibacter litoralis KT71]
MDALNGVPAQSPVEMERNIDGAVRCSLSESLIITLLKLGAVKAEQLQCMDEVSAAQLKLIVLRSCR